MNYLSHWQPSWPLSLSLSLPPFFSRRSHSLDAEEATGYEPHNPGYDPDPRVPRARPEASPRYTSHPTNAAPAPAPTRKENHASNGLHSTTRGLTRTAPVLKVALIPPPHDDPSTRKRPTRPCCSPTRPRRPNTRYIGSPFRPQSAPQHAMHPYGTRAQ